MNHFTLEDMRPGLAASFEIEITDEMLRQFQTISGDCNPLHVDENYAIEQGYPGRVVYGMLVSSFYSTLAGVYLPGERCLLQSVNVKMPRPVFIGDCLTIGGVVQEVHEAVRTVIIKAQIVNQEGLVVSKARIQASVV